MAGSQQTAIVTCVGLWASAVIVGMASATVSGQSLSPNRPVGIDREWKRSNPYSSLFEPKGRPSPGVPAALVPQRVEPKPAAPRVVCGMTLIPADPGVDPGIAAPPSSNSTRFTVRAVEPPNCRS